MTVSALNSALDENAKASKELWTLVETLRTDLEDSEARNIHSKTAVRCDHPPSNHDLKHNIDLQQESPMMIRPNYQSLVSLMLYSSRMIILSGLSIGLALVIWKLNNREPVQMSQVVDRGQWRIFEIPLEQ
ncbi:hypothetical protein PGT21_033806 [Puccinia graminis f. sp. tritici]|uniref:Uncharacterized protein n=1 Tax=Puccinia graminis f. sp. tritici TaxID=56615 RepID=A0A5B0MR11_PUCGR|nr:hypothetical protein PGT21_033806 [Puccinia graminis f. sp. tritici]KAA1109802.1 hypothetical protein PGTUg99_035326 [Puccinia graminis f. sp. tritici]